MERRVTVDICAVGHQMFEKSANKPALLVPPNVSVLLSKYYES